jgi:protein-tyrosine phosphatase
MKPIIYWIDSPGGGRIAVLDRPLGDDRLESEILGWREDGIDVVVSLLTEPEDRLLGLSREAELCRNNGLTFISFPIEDCNVPLSSEATLQLVKALDALLASGKSIGFHCRGGVGRSPLLASCMLMYSGKSAEESFELVGAARGLPVPQTPGQEVWGKSFAQDLGSSPR